MFNVVVECTENKTISFPGAMDKLIKGESIYDNESNNEYKLINGCLCYNDCVKGFINTYLTFDQILRIKWFIKEKTKTIYTLKASELINCYPISPNKFDIEFEITIEEIDGE